MAVNFPTQPTTDAPASINTGAFWPLVELAKARLALRIDDTITTERLFFAISAAAWHVNAQLSAFQATCLHNGTASLSAYQPEKIVNDQSAAEFHYLRAVYSYAQADLLEKYADISATKAADGRNEIKQTQADEARAEAHAAVAAILGRNRCDSELI